MKTNNIYLDYAATTPVDERVIDAMAESMREYWGNVSSTHFYGQKANTQVEKALEDIAQFFNIKTDEFMITSGATESINQAIKGVLYAQKKKHFITSTIEHKAVLQTAQALMKEGYHATFLKPNQEGEITPEMVEAAITEDTALISLIWVQNETGLMLDIESIAKKAREHHVLFHVDATQCVPHRRVDVSIIDLMSMSAHKCYGPKGVGLLYKRRFPRIDLKPLIDGGKGQLGIRSGTIPNEQIIGLSTALSLCAHEFEQQQMLYKNYAKIFLQALSPLGITHNMLSNRHLDHIINLHFPEVNADSLQWLAPAISISKGSACDTDDTLPSYVLTEMGYSPRHALQSVRISFGRYTREEEVRLASEYLASAAKHLQSCARGIQSTFVDLQHSKISARICQPKLLDEAEFTPTHQLVVDEPHIMITMDFNIVNETIAHLSAKIMAPPFIHYSVDYLAEYLRGANIEDLRALEIEKIVECDIPSKYLRDLILLQGSLRQLF